MKLTFWRIQNVMYPPPRLRLSAKRIEMKKYVFKVVYQLGEGPDTFMGNIVKQVVDRINQNKPEVGDTKVN